MCSASRHKMEKGGRKEGREGGRGGEGGRQRETYQEIVGRGELGLLHAEHGIGSTDFIGRALPRGKRAGLDGSDHFDGGIGKGDGLGGHDDDSSQGREDRGRDCAWTDEHPVEREGRMGGRERECVHAYAARFLSLSRAAVSEDCREGRERETTHTRGASRSGLSVGVCGVCL